MNTCVSVFPQLRFQEEMVVTAAAAPTAAAPAAAPAADQ